MSSSSSTEHVRAMFRKYVQHGETRDFTKSMPTGLLGKLLSSIKHYDLHITKECVQKTSKLGYPWTSSVSRDLVVPNFFGDFDMFFGTLLAHIEETDFSFLPSVMQRLAEDSGNIVSNRWELKKAIAEAQKIMHERGNVIAPSSDYKTHLILSYPAYSRLIDEARVLPRTYIFKTESTWDYEGLSLITCSAIDEINFLCPLQLTFTLSPYKVEILNGPTPDMSKVRFSCNYTINLQNTVIGIKMPTEEIS